VLPISVYIYDLFINTTISIASIIKEVI